ncbi:GNAT family N-acetyltransferase [Deinococcus roseus]|uniref:N-acetyltransferase domain-containing protein n=1 Tax=Deinococcus roseus TaxID=392414 RepID=A0ABQ2CVJ4_9DEIO|nr:GNAT family N-acetyltransferase [Deinococcus roseus]GGJ18340.1 hypothetical protein GCM10008938_00610 [Deinococcus roseus]
MDLEMLEFTEARAFTAQYQQAPDSFGLQASWHDQLCRLAAPKMDVFMFNRLLGINWEQDWEHLLAPYREAKLQKYGVAVAPNLLTADLKERLAASGLEHKTSWVKMYRPAGDAPEVSSPFRIERIDSRHAAHFAEVVTLGFQMPAFLRPWLQNVVGIPGWVSYLTFKGDTPVGAGALHVQGESAWLGLGCTLPEFRNQGSQGLIMRTRVQDALDLGCKWVVVETGAETPEKPNPSYHNMVRMGFKLAYSRMNFLAK